MGLTSHIVRGERGERMLLLLHGLGADERDLAALVPHIDPEGAFLTLLLRGQYSAPPGYAWFQIDNPATMGPTLETSITSINESFDESLDRNGLRREDAIIGGFSQGAATAFAMVFRDDGRPKPAGILAMSGFLVPSDRFTYDFSDAPPVLWQHGTQDQLIPIDRASPGAKTLADAGVPLTWREYPMDHQVTMESVQDAKDWLGRVVAGERPSEPGSVPQVEGQPTEMRGRPAPEAPVDEGPVPSVTAATFDQQVLGASEPTVVLFWTPRAQQSAAMEPVVAQIVTMRQGSYRAAKINVDQAPELAQRFELQGVPTVALFRNGRLERKVEGMKSRQELEGGLGMLVIP